MRAKESLVPGHQSGKADSLCLFHMQTSCCFHCPLLLDRSQEYFLGLVCILFFPNKALYPVFSCGKLLPRWPMAVLMLEPHIFLWWPFAWPSPRKLFWAGNPSSPLPSLFYLVSGYLSFLLSPYVISGCLLCLISQCYKTSPRFLISFLYLGKKGVFPQMGQRIGS